MTQHFLIPDSVRCLAEALRPIEQRLSDQLWVTMENTGGPSLSRREVRSYFTAIRRFAGTVTWCINYRLAPLVRADAPNQARIHAAARELDDLVQRQLERLHMLQTCRDVSGQGLDQLLVHAYRHNLQQLLTWLSGIVRVVDCPQAIPHGRSHAAPTVTLVLEFTACPALQGLRSYLQRPGYRSPSADVSGSINVLWPLLKLVLGISLVVWLFSDDADA